MYETVDETIRIRSAFIEQLESLISTPKSISVKMSILQFINNNLSIDILEPSISHFLLGFDTRKMDFGSYYSETTIASDRSLLKSIINILRDVVKLFTNCTNLDYAPVRICALSMEIILKLCKSDKTGKKY